MTTMYKFVA